LVPRFPIIKITYMVVVGNTVGHDFQLFMVLKNPEICLWHLSGNPDEHKPCHLIRMLLVCYVAL